MQMAGKSYRIVSENELCTLLYMAYRYDVMKKLLLDSPYKELTKIIFEYDYPHEALMKKVKTYEKYNRPET